MPDIVRPDSFAAELADLRGRVSALERVNRTGLGKIVADSTVGDSYVWTFDAFTDDLRQSEFVAAAVCDVTVDVLSTVLVLGFATFAQHAYHADLMSYRGAIGVNVAGVTTAPPVAGVPPSVYYAGGSTPNQVTGTGFVALVTVFSTDAARKTPFTTTLAGPGSHTFKLQTMTELQNPGATLRPYFRNRAIVAIPLD